MEDYLKKLEEIDDQKSALIDALRARRVELEKELETLKRLVPKPRKPRAKKSKTEGAVPGKPGRPKKSQ